MSDAVHTMASVEDDVSERGGDHTLLRPETIRALSREHRDLIVSLRALATLLREPDSLSAEEAETILGRILEAELEQVSVLDGEVLTALRLEQDQVGPLRSVELTSALRTAVRKSGRMTVVQTDGPVRVKGHREVIRQEISSALALAHQMAEGIVRASVHAAPTGGVVRVRAELAREELARARHNERLTLLHRMVRAEGGRFMIERDGDDSVTFHLSFYS